MRSSRFLKNFLIFGFLLLWFGIILQFILVYQKNESDFLKAFDSFFSYFTILTNILAGLSFAWMLFSPDSKTGVFFSKPAVLTAITVYIVIVALVYNTVLRGLVTLEGPWLLANELLHVIAPLLYLLFWIFFVDKHSLKYKNTFPWLIYPFLYMIFALIRGLFTKTYPYPFINAIKLGYASTAVNCILLAFVFWIFSLLFVFAGRLMPHQNS